jgi:ATP-binding cassette subfamily C protein CydCD
MRPFESWMWPYLRPARSQLTRVVLGSALAGGLVIAQAFAVTAFVVDAVHRHGLVIPGVVLALVLLTRAGVSFVVDAQAASAAARVANGLRQRVLAGLLRADAPATSVGSSAALTTRGVDAAEPYLTRYLPAALLSFIVPPLVLIAIATQDLLTAAIVVATLPLVPVFGWLVGTATRDRAEAQWRAMSSLAGHFVDVMRGLPTLVAFSRAEAQSGSIAAASARYRRRTTATLRIAFASSAILELVATLSVALVAVVVGTRLAVGDIGLGTGLVVLLLAPEAYAPIRRAGAEFHAAAEGRSAFAKVAAYGDGSPLDVGGAAEGDLALHELTVRYPGQGRPALEALSVRVPKRGLTVVVGPSGSGKSTLLGAIAGLVPHDAGSVTVGGQPVGGAAWREQVAWVPQTPSFSSGSVAENLRMSAPDATDPELWDVLDAVGLRPRVQRSVSGLGTSVGEDAAFFSGGERARLAFARGLLAERPWVLLDEPTARLDAWTRGRITDLIVALGERAAVVVATHDPDLIARADHVVGLEAASSSVDPIEPSRALEAVTTAAAERVRGRLFSSMVLEGLASASGVALTATAGWLIVKASEQPPVLTMLVAIVAVRAFGLGRPVLRYAGRILGHDAALRMLARRRVEVYDALVPLTPGALGRDRGDVLATAVDDVESVVDRQLRVRSPLASATVVGVVVVLVALALSPLAALVIGATCVLGGAIAFFGGRWGAKASSTDGVTTRAALSSCVVEAAALAPELVMWDATADVLERGMTLVRAMSAAARRSAVAVALARACCIAVCATGLVAVGMLGSGSVATPALALLTLIPLALMDVLTPLAEAGALSQRVLAADRRLAELAGRQPAVSSPDEASAPTSSSHVALEHVTAGWSDAVAFEDVSLALEEGQRLAVVGPSGCGKSTLAALLVRFIDPLQGVVEVGGRALTSWALADVRDRVGIVDDSPYVFSTSLAENMRLARRDATDAEIVDALDSVGLVPWLAGLPHGLNSMIGEGNAGLSGGERARLALARALLADRQVLVLDEPTAHLDEATAERTMDALLAATRGRSLVWITHTKRGLERVDAVLDLSPESRRTPVLV